MGTLDTLLGFLLIGTWESSGLFMFELVSAFHYYQHCSNEDAIYLKIIVAVTIGIDFVGLIAKYADTYLYTVTHWGDKQFLLLQYWPVPLLVMCGAIVAIIVQGYLISRYVRLTKKRFVGCGLLFFLLVELGASIAFCVLIMKRNAFEQRVLLEDPLKIWLITDAVVNTCIAFALILALYTHRPVLKRMDTIISRLIINTFESGCIPAFVAIATLVSYIISPVSNVPAIFFFPLSHLYVLTLLYALNIRQSLRNTTSGDDTYALSDIRVTSISVAHRDGVANNQLPEEETHNEMKV